MLPGFVQLQVCTDVCVPLHISVHVHFQVFIVNSSLKSLQTVGSTSKNRYLYQKEVRRNTCNAKPLLFLQLTGSSVGEGSMLQIN